MARTNGELRGLLGAALWGTWRTYGEQYSTRPFPHGGALRPFIDRLPFGEHGGSLGTHPAETSTQGFLRADLSLPPRWVDDWETRLCAPKRPRLANVPGCDPNVPV